MNMKPFALAASLVIALAAGIVLAGEEKIIELSDGSVVTGEVLSLSNGIYTVKSPALGTLKLEESKVRTIRQRTAQQGSGPAASASGAELTSIQGKMMSDKEIMGMVQSLQNDPEFLKILEDPEIMKAVNAGDVSKLAADPRFIKLMENPTVREIGKKVK